MTVACRHKQKYAPTPTLISHWLENQPINKKDERRTFLRKVVSDISSDLALLARSRPRAVSEASKSISRDHRYYYYRYRNKYTNSFYMSFKILIQQKKTRTSSTIYKQKEKKHEQYYDRIRTITFNLL